MKKKIIVVTGNNGKWEEYKRILGSDIKRNQFLIDEIQGSIYDIINEKIRSIIDLQWLKNHIVIVEDTSLLFDKWGGMPGPYIKDFLKHMGKQSLAQAVEGSGATAICMVAVSIDGKIQIFKGKVRGTIVSSRGMNGFGWDSIFIPDGETLTYAQMTPDAKDKCSDRAIVLKKVREFLSLDQ